MNKQERSDVRGLPHPAGLRNDPQTRQGIVQQEPPGQGRDFTQNQRRQAMRIASSGAVRRRAVEKRLVVRADAEPITPTRSAWAEHDGPEKKREKRLRKLSRSDSYLRLRLDP